MTSGLKLKNWEGFTFDEENHIYKLADKLLTGVTTILEVRQKPFLIGWAAKETAGWLKDKQEQIKKSTPEEYEALLIEAKGAYRRKSKEALTSGTIAHDFIKKMIAGLIEAGQSIKKIIALQGELTKEPIKDEKALASINSFMDWAGEHRIVWCASELRLPSIEHLFGGTIDAVARIDDVLTIVDFKTSNLINEEAYLQTAAYWILLNENLLAGEERPNQRLIVRIPKDGSGFETKVVPTPLDFDCKTFLNLREAHRWNLLVERLQQEENQTKQNGNLKSIS